MRLPLLGGAVLTAFLCATSALADWTVLYQDAFDRPMMGPNWRPLRGDWRIEDGRLRITRQWPSDSSIYCAVPMRYEDLKAEFDLILGEKDSASIFLRSGEKLWGGGGINDAFGARFSTEGDSALPANAPRRMGINAEGANGLAPNTPHHVVLQIVGGKGTITVDGQEIVSRAVKPARSEINVHFGLIALPNAAIDNLVLSADTAKPVSPLRLNTPEENRRATVEGAQFLDPKDAACGFQKAIDSLPENGGAVILPEGTFLMRRHLVLRSNVTLRGQGPKTVLQACPAFVSAIEKVESKDGVHTVTVKDAGGFHVGDAVCYGPVWGHPGTVGVEGSSNMGVLVTAIAGNVLTVTEAAPEKANQLSHWFPLLYARHAEFVEVKDLTLRGEKNENVNVYGGFQTNPITFGSVTGARITRVNVETWKGDGISLQGGADAIVTDNTVTGCNNGFHPGTSTERFLFARNLSVGNKSGLYFCWYNRNGVYCRNTVDDFTGYPDAGDVFNIIALNKIMGSQRLTTGYGGVYFGNIVKSIEANKGDVVPGKHLYNQPARYFVIAGNQTERITLGDGTMGNILAGNGAAEIKADATKNIVSTDALPDLGLGEPGVGRTEPVQPPKLPEPVLDGRKYYDPAKPDCGFQTALDELGKQKTGTLLLPAGRYALGQSLVVPSGVTLAGQGIGTVLILTRKDKEMPAVRVGDDDRKSLTQEKLNKRGGGMTVQDVTVVGAYDATPSHDAAVLVLNSNDVGLERVDVRGWEGNAIGFQFARGKARDCRAIGCAGNGFNVGGSEGDLSNCIARANIRGFNGANGKARLEGCIAAMNREQGFAFDEVSTRLVANNASGNGNEGFLLSETSASRLIANLALANGGPAMHLARHCSQLQILCNVLSDEQVHPTQTAAIVEDEPGAGHLIRYNVATPMHRNPLAKEAAPAIRCAGRDCRISDNVTEPLLPSGSSIEALEVGYPPKK